MAMACAAACVAPAMAADDQATTCYVIYSGEDALTRTIIEAAAGVTIEHSLTNDPSEAPVRNHLTDKSNWKIAYGTIAMGYGPYAKMIDGAENGDGWMGYINDGFANSYNLGNPFVVIDLGEEVELEAVGILAGSLENMGYYDVMPAAVDFYCSTTIEDPQLTETERNLMNGIGIADDKNISAYVPVHNKIKEADKKVAWTRLGAISVSNCTAEHIGRYFYQLSDRQKGTRARYIKLNVTPFGHDVANAADRTKIFEFYVATPGE